MKAYTVNVIINDKHTVVVKCKCETEEEAYAIAKKAVEDYYHENGTYMVDAINLIHKDKWKKDNDLDYYDYWREVNP